MFTAHASVAKHFNLFETWRVYHEGTFYANTVGDTAHREIAIDASPAKAHHNALERLETLLVALDDTYL